MLFCTIKMKNARSAVRISIVAFFIVFLANTVFAADRIRAIVDNQVITDMDVKDAIAIWSYEMDDASAASYADDMADVLNKKALERLIKEKILYAEAERQGIKPDEAKVNARIERVRSQFRDENEFQRWLQKKGWTEADLRQQFAKQEAIRELIAKEVQSKIVITPTEEKEHFEKHKVDFCEVTSINLDSLFISREKYQQLSESDFDRQARKVYLALTKGDMTWKSAKNQFEQGSFAGEYKKADLAPAIANKLFTTKQEVYSQPIKLDLGYFIFRIENKDISCPTSYTEVSNLVKNGLSKEKFDQLLNEYVKQLKKNTYIEIRE